MAVSNFDMDDTDELITHEHIISVVHDRFGFLPKDKQVDAIRTLLADREDLILIAKTRFRKSIIFQAAPLISSPSKEVLIVMPLNALV